MKRVTVEKVSFWVSVISFVCSITALIIKFCL